MMPESEEAPSSAPQTAPLDNFEPVESQSEQQLVDDVDNDEIVAGETEPIVVGNLLQESKKGIHISNNTKRDQKDRKIYVHQRTGLLVRPPTSFGLFMHAYRRSFKDDKVAFLDFNKRATEQWAKMSAEDKEPYIERAKRLAEQYKKVEVVYLRKRVRQLQQQIKDYRKAAKEISRGRY